MNYEEWREIEIKNLWISSGRVLMTPCYDDYAEPIMMWSVETSMPEWAQDVLHDFIIMWLIDLESMAFTRRKVNAQIADEISIGIPGELKARKLKRPRGES